MITLEGYVHWKLTGQKVLGIGDVAGMFPVDIHNHDFDQKMVEKFDALVADKGVFLEAARHSAEGPGGRRGRGQLNCRGSKTA